MKYIIKFNGNFYLANWSEGDPARTVLKINAQRFRYKKVAEKTLKTIIKEYPNRNLTGEVVEVIK